MDKQALAVMIPLTIVFFSGLMLLSRTTIGRAIARRIGGEVAPDATLRIHELEAEVEGLRAELAQIHERIDFAERMLMRAEEVRPSIQSLIPTPV